MRKLLFPIAVMVLLVFACQQGPVRYTQNSPEIDTIKKLMANYDAKTYDVSLYADTSKTYYNTKDNPLTPDQAIAYHKENDNGYSSRSVTTEHEEYEMVITDDGETWVNCWLEWKGTLSANGEEFVIPLHLTYQFVDGKIVREHGYWDPSAIVLALQKIEAVAATAEEEEETE